MRWIKNTFITAVFGSSALCFAVSPEVKPITPATAETPATTVKAPPPYGDNPNIFKVLAHKTQEKVQHTAEKVEDATETGLAKIKPKVNQAWDAVTGGEAQNVPIEQKPLNQSSNNTPAPKPNPVAPAAIVQPPTTPNIPAKSNAETQQPASATTEASPAGSTMPAATTPRLPTPPKTAEVAPNKVFFL